MKTECEKKLLEIINCVDEKWKNVPFPFLLGGTSGILLLLSASYKHKLYNGLHIENLAQNILEMEIMKDPGLSAGYSGIYWIFKYLHANDMLTDDDFNYLPNKYIHSSSIALLKAGNYDLLHGALGCVITLLYNQKNINSDFYNEFFTVLEGLFSLSDNLQMIEDYDFKNGEKIKGQVNLGLAHGIPSILKFYINCIDQNINKSASIKMARKIIFYILSTERKNLTISSFPYIINNKNDDFQDSRLGWCYGDLGIGFILYQAAIILYDDSLKENALNILIRTTKRRSEEETMVIDAGICHGSSGVAHIYNKMWHYTQNLIFKDATDFWIRKTLDLSTYTDGLAGYKTYNPLNNDFENSLGLLEGISGIGLSLLSYISGDFDWDYCLMLNNSSVHAAKT